MFSPRVSIVTPVYNQAEFIAETIKSVLSQDIAGLEYLVVDDGSTDDIDTAVAPYLSKIRYIKKENSGQASTLNFAWSQCEGEYLGYLSADDRYRKNALSELIEHAYLSNSDVVYPDFCLINQDGEAIRDVRVQDYSYYDLVILLQCLPGPGAIFRREAFLKSGGWNAELRQCPDFEFWYRLACQNCRFSHLSKVLADYRVHGNSAMVRPISSERANEIIRIIGSNEGFTRIERRKQIASAFLIASRLHGQSSRYLRCISFYAKAIAVSPSLALRPRSIKMLISGLLRISLLKFQRVIR